MDSLPSNDFFTLTGTRTAITERAWQDGLNCLGNFGVRESSPRYASVADCWEPWRLLLYCETVNQYWFWISSFVNGWVPNFDKMTAWATSQERLLRNTVC